jgi:hypothetical protein
MALKSPHVDLISYCESQPPGNVNKNKNIQNYVRHDHNLVQGFREKVLN